MTTQEATNVLPTDQEIAAKIKERTTPELLEFRGKLKRMGNNPQAMAIRFHIIRELLLRHMVLTGAIDGKLGQVE